MTPPRGPRRACLHIDRFYTRLARELEDRGTSSEPERVH